MSVKHTPGLWAVLAAENKAYFRLIDAAPDLLRTLIEIADVTSPGDGAPNTDWIHATCLAAIAKAAGEQP